MCFLRSVPVLLFMASLCFGACAPRLQEAPSGYEVTVRAGPYDRENTVTPFRLPEGLSGGAYRLVDEAGRAVPVQADAEGNAWFVLDRLPAGAARTYRLEAAEAPLAESVDAWRHRGSVWYYVGGEPLLRYNAWPTPLPRRDVDSVYQRGGYIEPVLSPSGKRVTQDYPEDVHTHQHGIFAAWREAVFQGRHTDFWNVADRVGAVEPVAVDTVWEGPVHGGLTARHRYVDLSAPEPVTALRERWDLYVYNVEGDAHPYRLFDLVITQEAATDSALHLPEYHYGGLAFRGNSQWRDAEGTVAFTSEGHDRIAGNATRARWTYMGGPVDGAPAGIAVLGHPGNFRAPEPVRIHPSEPYFTYTPSQLGDWSITPEAPYVARYRFVVQDGTPDPERLERLWQDYARPPEVVVES